MIFKIQPRIIWKRLLDSYYDVSNFGIVWSNIAWRGTTGRLLKPNISDDGRRIYHVFINGESYCWTAARCVALAFIGTPPTSRHIALHNDGNCTNDYVGNIRWGTYKDNSDDTIKHGTRLYGIKNHRYGTTGFNGCKHPNHKGSKNPRTKLTEVDVIQMRELRKSGMCYDEVSKLFPQVGWWGCYCAINRHTWTHIK